MQIFLNNEESESYFLNALCNSLSYVETGYDLELTFNPIEYKDAQSKLEGMEACYEDTLIQILRDGGTLTMVDHGCEGEYTREIKLADVHERVQQAIPSHLMDMINENDDAETGDVIIQQVFFKEVIFG